MKKKSTIIKRAFIISAIVVTILSALVACNGKQAIAGKEITYEDTVGFSQFQTWKAMNTQLAMQQMTMPAAPVAAKRPAVKSNTSQSGSMNSSSTHQAKTRKGWSKAAKYAAIGGGGGAILGAVINKRNRVVGAVLGGILGGGAGYGIGRSQGKKDGRY